MLYTITSKRSLRLREGGGKSTSFSYY